MKVEKFEDLIAWKEAMRLATIIFERFGTCPIYAFRDQMLRAVMSISNNIAEGFERKSNKEFARFLFIARGSAGEVRNLLYLAEVFKLRIKFWKMTAVVCVRNLLYLAEVFKLINQEERSELISHSKRVSYLIYRLIKANE